MPIKIHKDDSAFFSVKIKVIGPLNGDWPTVICDGRFLEIDKETGELQPWLFYHPHQNRDFRIACSNAGRCDALIDQLFDCQDLTPEENDALIAAASKVSQIMSVMYHAVCDAVYERDKKWIEKCNEIAMGLWLTKRGRGDDCSSTAQGYVYLIRHRNGLTKIGYSRNPKARENTLQAEDPRLQMIHCFSGNMELERRLHKAFSHLRKRGEWFELEQRHIDWILFFLRDNDNEHIVRQCNASLPHSKV